MLALLYPPASHDAANGSEMGPNGTVLPRNLNAGEGHGSPIRGRLRLYGTVLERAPDRPTEGTYHRRPLFGYRLISVRQRKKGDTRHRAAGVGDDAVGPLRDRLPRPLARLLQRLPWLPPSCGGACPWPLRPGRTCCRDDPVRLRRPYSRGGQDVRGTGVGLRQRRCDLGQQNPQTDPVAGPVCQPPSCSAA